MIAYKSFDALPWINDSTILLLEFNPEPTWSPWRVASTTEVLQSTCPSVGMYLYLFIFVEFTWTI